MIKFKAYEFFVTCRLDFLLLSPGISVLSSPVGPVSAACTPKIHSKIKTILALN